MCFLYFLYIVFGCNLLSYLRFYVFLYFLAWISYPAFLYHIVIDHTLLTILYRYGRFPSACGDGTFLPEHLPVIGALWEHIGCLVSL